MSGTVLLKSKRAYCFCGFKVNKSCDNSIESIGTDTEEKWKTLPLSERLARTFHLDAVSLGGKLILFGGRSYESYHSYIVSEEGEIEKDLLVNPFIPGGMCSGSFTLQRGRIFAISDRIRDGVRVFDGKNWSFICDLNSFKNSNKFLFFRLNRVKFPVPQVWLILINCAD